MRTLRFIVEDQVIKRDPDCDFTNLVPGTEGYLQVHFSFSPAWDGCAKVVAFSSLFGTEYTPQLLKDGRTCIIPSEALAKSGFNMQVLGKKDGYKITTNQITIIQDGGRS